ncbi:hypothetical protein F0P96_02050 [Hymenobacter busanensis]|uniref:Uncharacterized protein n=1 Tax=Hymenobacter busanensis TaxID=2607656 RepID=A0A7L4ZVF5_9BACT|nr:hypothetical protein [Hymenobacter busanensis]KAA9339425.1 hypothetical protein F0P96_02050 [Hymenobacter busanensis]QHJ06816.1 hypothetical protein GUY19_05700 [Hymenobacter busanensis]
MPTVTTTPVPPHRPPTRGAGKLLLKAFLLSLPFSTVVGSYFILDPFQVLYHYDAFTTQVIPNRDYVSTQTFVNNYPQHPYQSFILGNSRTLAFLVSDWAKYTHDPLGFHYDAMAESLYGVWKKLQFLEDQGARLRHVLIICDQQLLSETRDIDAHLFRKDPRLTGELPFRFQLSFFKAYLSNFFFFHYWKLKATGAVTPGMEGMFNTRGGSFAPVTNDMLLPEVEQLIAADSVGFYAHNPGLPPRPARQPVSKAVIGPEAQQQLVAIRSILERNHTNFHFVISPLYAQERLNPADEAYLVRTFGRGYIHNFSGVNELTKYPGHYYEESHYRPLVGRKILQLIYVGDSTSIEPGRGARN